VTSWPRSETVEFASGGRVLGGYLAMPEGKGPFPAVVVIHEAYGLNDNIRDITRRFAGEGYAALGVDLFAGSNRAVCMARFMTGLFVNTLCHSGIRGLRASLDYLCARPEVDADRVGAVGYCMGGSFAVAWACTDDRLKAIAPYYAMNPRPFSAVERLCPVVGSYPARDPVSTGDGHRLDRELDRLEVDHDIKFYPGTVHGFFAPGIRHNDVAAKDSWGRVLAFFEEKVKAAKTPA
jgi:carboxymethylenebutenolidase